jgi:hypothetical protein
MKALCRTFCLVNGACHEFLLRRLSGFAIEARCGGVMVLVLAILIFGSLAASRLVVAQESLAAGTFVQPVVSEDGPRVSDSIPSRLTIRGGEKYCLVRNLGQTLRPEAVTVSAEFGAGATVDCGLKPVGGGWELNVNKKKVAKVAKEGAELWLRTMDTDAGLLNVLGYLVLQVRHGDDHPALQIPLSKPIDTRLHVHALLDKKKAARAADDAASVGGGGGRSERDPVEGFSDGEAYALFADESAQKSVESLLSVFPDLYETIEFDAQAGVTSRTVPGKGGVGPGFTLSDPMGRGVLLRRTEGGKGRYRREGYTFPLAYGEINEKFKGVTVFEDDLLQEIPKAFEADMKAARFADSDDGYSLTSKLFRIGKIDRNSLGAARAFPLAAVQGCKVRFTLKQPGKEGGFVVVDSLKSEPPTARQGNPEQP